MRGWLLIVWSDFKCWHGACSCVVFLLSNQ
jgi:hypothetical protein